MRPQGSDKIGSAIRKLRLARGWTLAELSDKCGVPLSTLSRVELGQNALNYEKLVRLCQALDVDLQGLVARDAQASFTPSGRRSVIRAGQGAPITFSQQSGRRAAEDLLDKSLSPIILELDATTPADQGPLHTLGGEAYLLVLKGAAVLHSDLYAPLSLGAGDAVYFDGRSPHALASATAAGATVLLVAAGEESFEG